MNSIYIKYWVLCLLVGFQNLKAQQIFTLSEIDSEMSQKPKYILIEFYTDWCGLCAIQDKKIQNDQSLIELLDTRVYYVKFKADSKQTLVFNGHEFRNEEGKNHDFAIAVFGEDIAYPAWVMMNPKYEIVFQFIGLLESKDLKIILSNLLE